MTRHVLRPFAGAIVVAAMLGSLAYAAILLSQAFAPVTAAPLPPNVEYSPPTDACTPVEVPLIWDGELVCVDMGATYVRPAS